MTGVWPDFSVEEVEAATSVLRSGKVNYWTGTEGRSFEGEFAAFCNTKYAIAVANGTVALELALRAAGIGPSDEVIVTPRTFIASASCVVMVGARPVFADIDPDSQNITPETVAAVLTPRTRAVIAVHHAGWPCEMDGLMELADRHNLLIIEDCAQAHGARYKDRPVGGIGHIGAFSFCQDKIMTTAGEGGMVVTNDTRFWNAMWSFKDHGKSYDAVHNERHAPGFRWLHRSFGTNMRMTEVQAAIGRIQLRKLADWHARRAANAARLAAVFNRYPFIRVPLVPAHIEHAWYRFYAFVRDEYAANGAIRDQIIAALTSKGLPAFVGSCPEVYNEAAFDGAGLRPVRPLSVAQSMTAASLAFLVHPTLSEADLDEICTEIDAVLQQVASTLGA